MFVLTNKIIRNRQHYGYTGNIVVGRLGYGKSAYCLKVAFQIYKHDGYSDADAWQLALDSMVFSIPDIVKKIRSHNSSNRAKIVIIDDASVHLSSLTFFHNVHQVRLMQGVLATIRTSVESLMINCPDLSQLMKSVRKSDDYYIRVTKAGEGPYTRLATGYERITAPSQSKRIRREWVDHFSCFIPNKYYSIYMKERDRYKDDILNEIEIRMNTASEKMRKMIEKYREGVINPEGQTSELE